MEKLWKNEKYHPQLLEMEAIVVAQPLYLQARSIFFCKYQDTDLGYPEGTSFLPNKNTLKTASVFSHVLYTKRAINTCTNS